MPDGLDAAGAAAGQGTVVVDGERLHRGRPQVGGLEPRADRLGRGDVVLDQAIAHGVRERVVGPGAQVPVHLRTLGSVAAYVQER